MHAIHLRASGALPALIVAALCIGWTAAFAAGHIFSLDAASSTIGGDVTPDDLLLADGNVMLEGRFLGLRDNFAAGRFDDLNALSLSTGSPAAAQPLFSVDRVSWGAAGTAVREQAAPGEAAADVFRPDGRGGNAVHLDEEALSLKPGFFRDDLNAYSAAVESGEQKVYFSIDALSASATSAFPTPASVILVSDGSWTSSVFADAAAIGLLPGDDIDALIVLDAGGDGIANAGTDRAVFSLSPFSTSTYLASGAVYAAGLPGSLSPADVLVTNFDGSYELLAAAADLGLLPEDNVDALEVPEPATMLWIALGWAGLSARGRRARHRGD